MRASEDGFTTSFRELFVPAARLARRLTDDPATAEDLAAEALARAYANWASVSRADSPRAWVLRVTTNLAVDHARRRGSHRRFAPLLLDPGASHDDGELMITRLALVAALAALPRRQREAVALRYLADLDEAEVSRALGISPSTVRTHLQRGLEGLRAVLDVKEVERVVAS